MIKPSPSRRMKYNPGVGATDKLKLRVSVATLVRVVYKDPSNSEWILALERKATLHESKTGRHVEIKSQPFGGAIRIQNLNLLKDAIGDFQFDSDRSRSEQDFRILINPLHWEAVREFCIQQFNRDDDSILETNPGRELAEEFYDALGVNIKPEQYISMPVTTIIENKAMPTRNIHAMGIPTVRVYRIFEASITDSSVIQIVMENSEKISDQALYERTLENARNSGSGRANTILALSLKGITDFYSSIPLEECNVPVLYEKNLLDETVSLVLDGITVPKYQRLG